MFIIYNKPFKPNPSFIVILINDLWLTVRMIILIKSLLHKNIRHYEVSLLVCVTFSQLLELPVTQEVCDITNSSRSNNASAFSLSLHLQSDHPWLLPVAVGGHLHLALWPHGCQQQYPGLLLHIWRPVSCTGVNSWFAVNNHPDSVQLIDALTWDRSYIPLLNTAVHKATANNNCLSRLPSSRVCRWCWSSLCLTQRCRRPGEWPVWVKRAREKIHQDLHRVQWVHTHTAWLKTLCRWIM